MIVLGLWQVLAGLTALVRGGPYVATSGYTYTLDLTLWGVVMIVIGALVGGAAVFVLRGQTRAGSTAIMLAILSMIVNFLLIPLYPIWSFTIIGLGVTLIWALTTPDR
jgi:hypothetical protein